MENMEYVKYFLVGTHAHDGVVTCEVCDGRSVNHSHVIDSKLNYRILCMNCTDQILEVFKSESKVVYNKTKNMAIAEYVKRSK